MTWHAAIFCVQTQQEWIVDIASNSNTEYQWIHHWLSITCTQVCAGLSSLSRGEFRLHPGWGGSLLQPNTDASAPCTSLDCGKKPKVPRANSHRCLENEVSFALKSPRWVTHRSERSGITLGPQVHRIWTEPIPKPETSYFPRNLRSMLRTFCLVPLVVTGVYFKMICLTCTAALYSLYNSAVCVLSVVTADASLSSPQWFITTRHCCTLLPPHWAKSSRCNLT